MLKSYQSDESDAWYFNLQICCFVLLYTAYLFALVFSISVANIDDRISLYKENQTLWYVVH